MGTWISKTEQIRHELEKKGYIKTYNTLKDLEIIKRMDEKLLAFRRNFRKKQAMSRKSASEIFLNC